jgi:hypothetical protein
MPRQAACPRLDLPRFRGEMRAWDQALWLYVMLSSGFVAFFGSAPGGAILPFSNRHSEGKWFFIFGPIVPTVSAHLGVERLEARGLVGTARSSPQPPLAVARRARLCVGHVRQLGGESPLCNLMEVKH